MFNIITTILILLLNVAKEIRAWFNLKKKSTSMKGSLVICFFVFVLCFVLFFPQVFPSFGNMENNVRSYLAHPAKEIEHGVS